MIRAAALVLTLAPAFPAGAFDFAQPIACTLGETCHVQNYVDRDPGPGTADVGCGNLTYDGHDGTDFALPNLAAMQAGVQVLAAAPGRVRGIRDGMPDIAISDPAAPPLNGRDCGNGVAIDQVQRRNGCGATFAMDMVFQFLKPGSGACSDDDGRAHLGERRCRGSANASARAGDQRNLPGKGGIFSICHGLNYPFGQ